jgi:cell division protein FtsW
LAGLPPIGAAILVLIGSGGFWLAYVNFGHVQSRLEKFFSAAPFENYQVGRAMQSFSEGGFFGRGPGEGTIKSVLPDAHTDYIFAVIGEEYGVSARRMSQTPPIDWLCRAFRCFLGFRR